MILIDCELISYYDHHFNGNSSVVRQCGRIISAILPDERVVSAHVDHWIKQLKYGMCKINH